MLAIAKKSFFPPREKEKERAPREKRTPFLETFRLENENHYNSNGEHTFDFCKGYFSASVPSHLNLVLQLFKMCSHIDLGIAPWYSPGQTNLTLLLGKANISWENTLMSVKSILTNHWSSFMSWVSPEKGLISSKQSLLSSDLLIFASSAVTHLHFGKSLLNHGTCWVSRLVLLVTVGTWRCKIIPRY